MASAAGSAKPWLGKRRRASARAARGMSRVCSTQPRPAMVLTVFKGLPPPRSPFRRPWRPPPWSEPRRDHGDERLVLNEEDTGEVVGISDCEKLGQAHPTSRDPAFDRAHRDPADVSGFLVRESFRHDQEKRLALVCRELSKCSEHVLDIALGMLLRRCPKAGHIGAARVLDLVLGSAALAVEDV